MPFTALWTYEAEVDSWNPFTHEKNALLAALARANPGSLEDLSHVKGVGPERSRKYGDAILSLLGREPAAQ